MVIIQHIQVTVQIASDLLQNKAKGRSLQVFTAKLPRTFNAVMEQIRGELNSYIIHYPLILNDVGAEPCTLKREMEKN